MHPEGHDMFHTEQEICTMEPQRAALTGSGANITLSWGCG